MAISGGYIGVFLAMVVGIIIPFIFAEKGLAFGLIVSVGIVGLSFLLLWLWWSKRKGR